MITKVKVQLKGETEPQDHLALVFHDVTGIADFIVYRNALTQVVKAVLTTEEYNSYLTDECFWLIQLSEFISSGLDHAVQEKGGEV